MKLIDTHTHISCPDFDEDRPEVLSRALEVCDYLIDIGSGTSVDAFNRAKDFAEKHERVYFTAGVHPHDADKIGQDSKALARIEELMAHPKCVAVGECGLDYYYDNSSRENQIKVFNWHIELASKLNMPLMIHTRDAEEDTKKCLKDFNGKAVFHCFTGTQDLASFGIAKGFYVSFSGIVTFKKAEALKQVAINTPMDQILVETDSPYLAPVPMRGKRNESSFIKHTAEYIADLKKVPATDFTNQTSENALKLFSKMSERLSA